MVGVCVIKTCCNKKSSLHRFPNPDKYLPLYSKWLELCGNEQLLNLPPPTVYANRRLCRLHFLESDFGPYNRLLPTACPRLNLPDTMTEQERQTDCDKQTEETGITSDLLLEETTIDLISKQLDDEYIDLSNQQTQDVSWAIGSPVTQQDNQPLLSNKSGETTSNNQEVVSSGNQTYNIVDKPITNGDRNVQDNKILHTYKILLNKPNSQGDGGDDNHKDDDPSNISIVESTPIISDDDSHGNNNVYTNTNKEISYSNKTIQVTTPERKDTFFLTPENISTICRICLKLKGVVHMFENKYEELSFGEILEMSSPIKPKDDETLSQYMCQNCSEELIQCYNFRTKCNKSEQILLNFKTELAKNERRKERVREKLKDLTLRFHDYESILKEEEVNDMTNRCSNAKINEEDDTKQQIPKKRFYLLKGDLSDETGFRGNVNVREIDESNAKSLITGNHQTTVSLKVGNAVCNIKTAVLQDEANKSAISSTSSDISFRNPIKRRKLNPNYQMIRRAVYSLMNTWTPNVSTYPLKKRKSIRTARRKSEKISKPKEKKLVIPGVCEVCNETYATMEEYKQHTKATKHYLNPHFCKSCGKIYPDKHRLKIHWNVNHENNRAYMCEKCGKCYKTRGYLMSHLKTHGQKNYVCSTCGLSCSTMKEIVNHRKANHPLAERKHCCEFCGEVFTRPDTLRHHRNRIHLKIHRQFCHICGKGYLYKSTLKKHMVSHSIERYNCQLCSKSFKLEQRYLKHMRIRHPGTDKNTKEEDEIQMMECSYCNCFCRNKQSLSMHIKETHDAIICIYCDSLFDTNDELENHRESSHTVIVDFSCRYCGKTFSESHMLCSHLDIHRKKQFQCQLCFKRFSGSVQLKIHTVIHTQRRIHKCQYCDKAFLYSTNRILHERCHTRENIGSSSYKKRRTTHIVPLTDEIKVIKSDNELIENV